MAKLYGPNGRPLEENLVEASTDSIKRFGKHLHYGGFLEPLEDFDLIDASTIYEEFGLDEKELRLLRRISEVKNDCKFRYEKPLKEVAAEILKAETEFDLNAYDIFASAGGARSAIKAVLRRVVNEDRSFVMAASPNWHFDKIISPVPGAICLPFYASSAETFTRNFVEFPKKHNVAAVILVDPSNPLGYRLTREQVREIEEEAKKYGIVPIFDDVFRGLQEKGNRHSSSEYSSSSVVVETTSKRFGPRGLGVTWTLVPKSIGLPNLEGLEMKCEGCSSYAALVTDALYSCDYGSRVRKKLVDGTRAFSQGLMECFEGTEDKGLLINGFEGMPVFSYVFPTCVLRKSVRERLALMSYLEKVAGVTGGCNWALNLDERSKTGKMDMKEVELISSFIRICPTKEQADRLYFAGVVIGETMRNYSK